MLVLNLITFLNLGVLFSLLYFKKDNPLPNKVLAFILINPGINFLSNANILSGNLEALPYFYFLAQFTSFFFAPLVHVYTRLLIRKKISYRFPVYYFTLAALLLTVYYALEFTWMDKSSQLLYLQGIQHEPYPIQMVINNSIFIVLQQVYFTISAIELYRYKKNLPNLLSNFEKTKRDYLTRFIQLIWLLNLVTLGLYALLPTIQVEYIYLPIVLTIIYFFILYFGFHYHSIFTDQSYEEFVHDNPAALEDTLEDTLTVAEESLQKEERELAEALESHLLKNESFKNPDLTLLELSNEIGTSQRKLSTAINKVHKKNFYDYINEKRVEKSKSLLLERPEITIEGVAYESGFNSRASFYRAFKKTTHLTPSEYLMKEKKEPQDTATKKQTDF